MTNLYTPAYRSIVAVFLFTFFLIVGSGADVVGQSLRLYEGFDNPNINSRGWINGTGAWNGAGFVVGGRWFHSDASGNPPVIWNPTLSTNTSFNDTFSIVAETLTNTTNNLDYMVFGLIDSDTSTHIQNDYLGVNVMENYASNGTAYLRFNSGGYCVASNLSIFPIASFTSTNNKVVTFNFTINASHIMVWNNVTNTFHRTNYTCTGRKDNLSVFAMSRILYSQVDSISVYNYPVVAPTMNVTFLSPANNTDTNSPFSIHYNMSSSLASANCTLYDNVSGIKDTKIAVSNVDSVMSSGALSEGNHSMIIICVNATTSATSPNMSYFIDDTFPTISLLLPVPTNLSVFDKVVGVTGTASDNNLWRVNVSIYNSTGGYKYSKFADGITSTTYDFSNASINSTTWEDGVYLIRIEASDSHTLESWDESYSSEIHTETTQKGETLASISFLESTLQILTDADVSLLFDRRDDRIAFGLQSENTGIRILHIISDSPMKKVKDSIYPCHYVTGDYWIDAQGLSKPVCVLDASGLDLQIVYEQPKGLVMTDSIGGLNIIEETYSFNITSCIPDWICDGFSSCYLNNSMICNSTSDLNSCGDTYDLNYTDDFGWFSCDYCTQRIVNISPLGNVCINSIRNISIQDLNFSTCCNLTNLSSDCVYGGYSYKTTGGILSFLENCFMPIQEIGFGVDLMMIILIMIGVILFFIGIAYSMSVLILLAGLDFFIISATLESTYPVKIFIGMLGVVAVFIFAMLEHDGN